ncbi:MAG TPA: hypothetical protein VHJ00_15880 [Bradyrhizobium sp.]|nr:hypothetical protein [Bradyrhizobium sp.]
MNAPSRIARASPARFVTTFFAFFAVGFFVLDFFAPARLAMKYLQEMQSEMAWGKRPSYPMCLTTAQI